jgi:hypothetical protein
MKPIFKFFVFNPCHPQYSFCIEDVNTFSTDDYNRKIKGNLLIVTDNEGTRFKLIAIKKIDHKQFLDLFTDLKVLYQQLS